MWSLRSRRRKPADQPMPNPTKAKADLERIRKVIADLQPGDLHLRADPA